VSLIKIKEPSKKKSKDNLNCVGLDFGTTNSVCSIKRNGKVEFIKDEKDKILIPSIVLFDDEKVFIGNEVLNNKNNLNSINSIKRNFTDDYDENIFFNEKKIKTSSIDVATSIFKHLKKNL
jgi:Molecular chaperone